VRGDHHDVGPDALGFLQESHDRRLCLDHGDLCGDAQTSLPVAISSPIMGTGSMTCRSSTRSLNLAASWTAVAAAARAAGEKSVAQMILMLAFD
jgi:hypothetical protein